MKKPELEVLYLGTDIVTDSGCNEVCSSECGSYTCQAECENFCAAECVGAGIYTMPSNIVDALDSF